VAAWEEAAVVVAEDFRVAGAVVEEGKAAVPAQVMTPVTPGVARSIASLAPNATPTG
jgi:hypothetical protein